MSWQPVPGNIMTQWAKDVSPENALPEYPRPQMAREEWQNLNGLWEFGITPRTAGAKPGDFTPQGEILVPFSIESALSGVKRGLKPDEWLWVRRTFVVPEAWRGKRVLLHFGAVDWETEVFVNGHPVGEHVGGYLPFWFDITDVLLPSHSVRGVVGEVLLPPSSRTGAGGEVNELLVRIWDPTEDHWQQRGKQTKNPRTIWYTAVSGIWQTVWLEPVPQTYIDRLKITPDVEAGTVRVKTDRIGPGSGSGVVSVRVFDAGALIGESKTESAAAEVTVPIPNPKLWSPDSPHLYDLEVTAGEDRVRSYFGMRKLSVSGGRLCLNNQPLFQLGPLDQGYWPDGLYTPPTDEAMRRDVELVKRLGCNMLRKHVKVEPARYYYYCDRLGLIVWQDMPNGGRAQTGLEATLSMAFNPRHRDNFALRRFGREKVASREDYRRELSELIDALYNFTCIGVWVPFNEGWGQFDAKATSEWLSSYDPSRLVDHASGWYDQGSGNFTSRHIYALALKPIPPEKDRALALTEYGGYSLKVEGHLWNPDAEYGYKKFTTSEALTDAYLNLLNTELKPWIDAGLSAAIYTQTTDVEVEVNGYVTYDRAVEKMDFEKVTEVHKKLIESSYRTD